MAIMCAAQPVGLIRHPLGRTVRPSAHMRTMTDSFQEDSDLDFEKMQAIRRIADSIGGHQMVKREGLPGSTCRNHVCAEKGTIFLTRGDIYRHQSSVAVNDLLSFLRSEREYDLADAGVSDEAMEEDFTFSALTDLLDATPAGRSYADRKARIARV